MLETPSPTARALRTLDLLRAHPGITAGRLSERLGVSERAARRYVAILREAGVPVEATRGAYGGYRLGRGVQLPPVVFAEHEALALAMAVLEGGAANRDGEDLVGSGLAKLVAALPGDLRHQTAMLVAHASAAPDRAAVSPDPSILATLVAASAARRQARITYQAEAGAPWEEVVDPWAVVTRHRRWYLLCNSHRAGAIRTYRIDRVRGVTQITQPFELPADLDPVATLEEHLGIGWAFPTRVDFAAPYEEVARWIRPPMGRLAATTDGCTLLGSTDNPTMYAAEWLAPLPFRFTVVGGAELRLAMATLAARLTAAAGA